MKPPISYFITVFLGCVVIIFNALFNRLSSQTPEILNSGALTEQFEFIHQRTNIYNNFRAIREDMFQKIRNNSIDSLAKANAELATLNQQLTENNEKMDSLGSLLATAYYDRDLAIRERNSMFFLGVRLHKTIYSLIVWTIIGGLISMLILGLIIYKRHVNYAISAKNELEEIRAEFEDYRKKSRLRFEQQAIDHFNEIKRLKGKP